MRSPLPLTACLIACLLAAACTADPSKEDRRFTELMDRIWAWNMANYPEWATSLGKREGLNRWCDLSPGAIEERRKAERDFLRQLESIHGERLSSKEWLNYRLLLRDYQESVEGQKFPREVLVLDQMGGVHQEITDLMEKVPAERVEDFEAILARLRAFPRLVEQHRTLLERGLQIKVTPPRITLRDIPRQIDALTSDSSLGNPILSPFRKEAPMVDRARLQAFRDEALQLLNNEILPSLKNFRSFVQDRYIPEARESVGMSDLPSGRDWYAFRARCSTTTGLKPEEIHQIGLDEVARIRGEMEEVKKRSAFKGDLKTFGAHLRSDPGSYFKSEEELLAGYRDICKQADGMLPSFFGKLPRLPYGVRSVPEYAATSKAAAYYEPGSIEAGRAGYFFANTSLLDSRPKWQMEALALHEAVPGHHLQIALAQELGEKHELLRNHFYTAFGEGWALYCERLGLEMGFYKNPRSQFGRLNFEMWRAVRLVVDTGIHDMHWTREQAIAYFQEQTAMSDSAIIVEVDRYLVWPGQALAYKIGELKIRELRARAESSLGARFNLRAFHDALLSEGGLPLDILEERMNEWIKKQKESVTP